MGALLGSWAPRSEPGPLPATGLLLGLCLAQGVARPGRWLTCPEQVRTRPHIVMGHDLSRWSSQTATETPRLRTTISTWISVLLCTWSPPIAFRVRQC